MEFSLEVTLHNLALMCLAYILAIPVAWDREVNERSAGLRTFPLVAVSACGFMLLAMNLYPEGPEVARVLQGIIGGIGFIGGGAILKYKGKTKGTATAAALWLTAGIGVAVAGKQIEIALLLSFMVFLTFRYLSKAKKRVDPSNGGSQSH